MIVSRRWRTGRTFAISRRLSTSAAIPKGECAWCAWFHLSIATPGPFLIVEIDDPVVGAIFLLDEVNKIAHRVAMLPTVPPRTATPSSTVMVAGAPKTKMVTEDLPDKTMEGVLVHGTRSTSTIPVDSIGNDRGFVETREVWTSPDLKEALLTVSHSPRAGDSTSRLIKISMVEPGPSLFQPPADTPSLTPKARSAFALAP